MPVTIRLRVPKDIDTITEKKVLKLRGGLIARGFTDIIYFEEEGTEHYIHYFTTEATRREEAMDYIAACITADALANAVELLPART